MAKDNSSNKRSDMRFSDEEMRQFSANMSEVAEQSRKLMETFLENLGKDGKLPDIDPLNIGPAFIELTTRMLANPAAIAEAQMALWQDYLRLWQDATLKMLEQDNDDEKGEPDKGDRRFRAAEWSQNHIFDFIKQSYLLTAEHVQNAIRKVEGLSPEDSAKIDFYTKQMIDALAPSNFILTNPEVLKATIDQRGNNLVRGLKNLLEDLERGDGELAIKMTDMEAFKVGENIAVTPGKVVFQNDLFQLIQYEAQTEKVFETPLVIFPPWINKFYILDLTAEKSFVRWAVNKGYTVFMVSWVNPGSQHRDKSFEHYMTEGLLTALDKVEAITGQSKTNVIGYCIAGTLLAATLAHLKAKGEENRIRSATFLTAQVDFEDAGDLRVFIDEDQLESIDKRMAEKGYLDSRAMASTFNLLRSNDLIWSFVVNNYLLGKEPFPFDLLFWNSDSTNLPRAMHRYYLKNMYLENNLVKPGKLQLAGTPIDLTRIDTPCYIQSGKEDHIAPAKSVFKMTKVFSGPIRFIVAGSGHIAGVVNPPEHKKYQYWTNNKKADSLENWLDQADEHKGSWWPDWHKWLSRRSGKKIPRRDIGSKAFQPIEDAPGSYVKVRNDLPEDDKP